MLKVLMKAERRRKLAGLCLDSGTNEDTHCHEKVTNGEQPEVNTVGNSKIDNYFLETWNL